MPSFFRSPKFLIPLCFFIVYVVWGSTYMFIDIAIRELPPFLVMAIRHLSASILLFVGIFSFLSLKQVTLPQIKNAVIAGILFIGIGSGAIGWVLVRLDTGFTALLISTQPLITVLLMWYFNKKRPPLQSFVGVFLGIIGIYLLVSQNEIIASADQWQAILLTFGCLFVWGYGSIFVSKADLPKEFMTNTAFQLLAGSSIILVTSFLVEDVGAIEWRTISAKVYWSLSFLIILGSMIVFMAFNYLLKQVTPEKVATSTYVNPIIALFLGWWFLDELVTTQSLIAAFIMLTGVIFINFKWETILKTLRIK